MGGGSYRYEAASARSFGYSTAAKEDYSYYDTVLFSNNQKRSIDPLMDIKGQIRESCVSAEHPDPITVYIGLDVTGSMGTIPKQLITGGFPNLMKKILDEGIEHVQICFIGIGDNVGDKAPIQVGQFETDDELQEKWLMSLYLEGGGGSIGPDEGEGYQLAWYLAARHTKVESFDKNGRKGILITIGDEQYRDVTSKYHINELFGGAQDDVDSMSIYNEACEKWSIYHINIMDRTGQLSYVKGKWEQLLGDHCINTQASDGSDVPDLIAGIIIDEVKKFNKSGKNLLTEDESEPVVNVNYTDVKSENAEDEHSESEIML